MLPLDQNLFDNFEGINNCDGEKVILNLGQVEPHYGQSGYYGAAERCVILKWSKPRACALVLMCHWEGGADLLMRRRVLLKGDNFTIIYC